MKAKNTQYTTRYQITPASRRHAQYHWRYTQLKLRSRRLNQKRIYYY